MGPRTDWIGCGAVRQPIFAGGAALDLTTGDLVWSADCGGGDWGPGPVFADAIVYPVGAAIDATSGECRWHDYWSSAGREITTVENGIGFSANGRTLWAVRAPTGTYLWRARISSDHRSGYLWTPVAHDGFVYAALSGGVRAYRAGTGRRLWSFSCHESGGGPIMAVANGVLYVGTSSGKIFALDARTGARIWRTHVERTGSTPYVAVANGVAYVTTEKLFALDASTGSILWRGGDFLWADRWSPPVIADGMVDVVGSISDDEDDSLYAFGVP